MLWYCKYRCGQTDNGSPVPRTFAFEWALVKMAGHESFAPLFVDHPPENIIDTFQHFLKFRNSSRITDSDQDPSSHSNSFYRYGVLCCLTTDNNRGIF
jgi:hypothetical protein